MRIEQSLVVVVLLVSLSVASDIASNREKRDEGDVVPIAGQHFNIATILTPPYAYKDKSKSGTDQYYGYIPDLVAKLANKLGFTYDFKEYERYGAKKDDGTWTGMMGALLENKDDPNTGVHIAAAPLTITKQREAVVDFIQPFSHVGLSVLIQKPNMKTDDAPDPKPWHFNFDVFKPLSAEVWILVTVMMIVVWLFFWLMNCFNPYEYGERYKRNLASEEQANLFTFTGSLWFTFTTLQWQGYDRAPRSIASKIMGCFWMVFITLTIVTYISSFVNHMFWASTVHQRQKYSTVPVIRDLADLVEHKDGYTYGTVGGGSTFAYLTEVAKAEEFKLMTKYWKTDEGAKDLVDTMDEGVEKARFNKYAFIGETMMIRHAISNASQCDLMDLGITFAMRSYGLAVNEGWEYKEDFDQAILHMIESGDIEAMEEKWWDEHRCKYVTRAERASQESKISALYLNTPQRVNMHMFWSPVVLIVVGIIISVGVGIGEILWYKYRGRYDANNRQRGQQLTNEEDGHI